MHCIAPHFRGRSRLFLQEPLDASLPPQHFPRDYNYYLLAFKRVGQEYLAPELLENKGHGKAVDWWSLGTLLFEMMTGLPPFYDQNMQRMYDKILHSPLRVPEYVGADAKSILAGLLQRKHVRHIKQTILIIHPK